MEIILSILIPALLLVYYLRSDWKHIKGNRILIGMLAGGTLLFYAGLAFSYIDPVFESLLKLGGACMFFTGVAFHSINRSQEKDPDRMNDGNE